MSEMIHRSLSSNYGGAFKEESIVIENEVT